MEKLFFAYNYSADSRKLKEYLKNMSKEKILILE